jgi:DNA-binding transcriptional LysR family regulator
LLDRHRSGAKVSRAGLDLLGPIAEVLDAADRLRALAGDASAARRLLRIGTVNAGTAKLLLPAIRDFQADNPGSAVEVRNLQQTEIETGLVEGTLDLGLVNLLDGDDIPPELEPSALVTGRPVAVLPADHPLTAQAEVSTDDLRAARFVAMRSGYLMYRFAHRLFGERPPAAWHATDGAEMGKMMVAESIGIALLPDYSVHGDPLERAGLIVARPITGDRTTVTMVAIRRRTDRLPPAVHEMLELLQRHARPREDAADSHGSNRG